MYSNSIYKFGWFTMQQDEKCVIDNNPRLQKRLEEYEELKRRDAMALAAGDTEYEGDEGFKGGLIGERIDTLFSESDEESGNIIKSQENTMADGSDSEELKALAAQELEEAKALAAQELEEARTKAGQELEEARTMAEQIRTQARDDAEKQKKEVMDEARQAGYDEGMRLAKAEEDKLRAELEKERIRLEEQYDQMIEELEPRFIDTITAVYNHIFGVELQNDRAILVHLIESTLRRVDSSRVFIVHVSKDDYPYVSMQKSRLTETAVGGQGVIDVIEDITLQKNECMIETDGGIFDCGVGTQLEELTKKLKLLSFQKDEKIF